MGQLCLKIEISRTNMPRYEKFCCCMPVDTGARIVAILGVVGSAIAIFGSIASIFNGNGIYDWDDGVLTVAIWDFFIYGCLLYGLEKKKHIFVLLWLVLRMIDLVLETLGCFILFCWATHVASTVGSDHYGFTDHL